MTVVSVDRGMELTKKNGWLLLAAQTGGCKGGLCRLEEAAMATVCDAYYAENLVDAV